VIPACIGVAIFAESMVWNRSSRLRLIVRFCGATIGCGFIYFGTVTAYVLVPSVDEVLRISGNNGATAVIESNEGFIDVCRRFEERKGNSIVERFARSTGCLSGPAASLLPASVAGFDLEAVDVDCDDVPATLGHVRIRCAGAAD
jgi:hypothetical protein